MLRGIKGRFLAVTRYNGLVLDVVLPDGSFLSFTAQISGAHFAILVHQICMELAR